MVGHGTGAAIVKSEGGSQETVPYAINGPLFLAGLVGKAKKFHGVSLTRHKTLDFGLAKLVPPRPNKSPSPQR